MVVVFVTFWLHHVDVLFQNFVQECAFDVHLMHFEINSGCQCQQRFNGIFFAIGVKVLWKTFGLKITFCN
jgi:hypothetical protein